MDVNSVIEIGRLTRDPKLSYTSDGVAVMEFSIAVNHMKKEEVSFFNCKAFGKTAENLKPYMAKGKQVCIDGYLKQDRWEKDGKKESRVIINCESIELLGGSSENKEQAYY